MIPVQIAELGTEVQLLSQQKSQFQHENHQLRNQVHCSPSPAVSRYCDLIINHSTRISGSNLLLPFQL